MASLAGKVIAARGAASGVGAAAARLLAARGARLALADVDAGALDTVAATIRGEGHSNVIVTQVEIRVRTQVRDWLAATVDKFGPLNGAANVAGVIGKHHNIHSIWELSTDEFEFVNAVNSRGLFHRLTEQLVPGVMQADGSIASVASICALRALGCTAVYTASKHAAVGLIQAAAAEAGPRGIRVNGMAPGTIETPMLASSILAGSSPPVPTTPLRRYGQPFEIAPTLSFLPSDESKFTTGAIYSVDGGWSAP